MSDPLRLAIGKAAKRAFAAARKAHDGVCGYGIYVDSDATTLEATVDTVEHLAGRSGAELDPATRWAPAEWAVEDVEGALFTKVRQELARAVDGCVNAAAFEQHRTATFEACVGALEDLRAAGLFADDAVVLFAVTQLEDPRLQKRWAKRLNPPRLYREYATLFT